MIRLSRVGDPLAASDVFHVEVADPSGQVMRHYGGNLIAVRGQAKNADEAWLRNKCRESPPGPANDSAKEGAKAEALPVPAGNERSGRSQMKSGNAIY